MARLKKKRDSSKGKTPPRMCFKNRRMEAKPKRRHPKKNKKNAARLKNTILNW
jgi:hypothetical protein